MKKYLFALVTTKLPNKDNTVHKCGVFVGTEKRDLLEYKMIAVLCNCLDNDKQTDTSYRVAVLLKKAEKKLI